MKSLANAFRATQRLTGHRVNLRQLGFCFCLLFSAVLWCQEHKGFTPCADSGVSVKALSKSEFKWTCAKVEETLQKLAGFGLNVNIETLIEFKQKQDYPVLDHDNRVLALGHYVRGQDRIQLLSLSDCILQDYRLFGLPIDAELYQSLVVHEITHAVIQLNAPDLDSPAAQEFWAYVVQIDLLPVRYVEVLKARYQDVFKTTLEINSIHYALNPNGFALAAHRWYESHGDELMQAMLKGAFNPDSLIEMFE